MSQAAPARGSESVKAALIEAACEGLSELGPRALSTRALGERAGVNHGQIHHYFGGKRGLLKAAMASLAAEHWHNSLERADGSPVPPVLSLAEDTRYWRAIAHAVIEGDLDLARVEIDEGFSVPRRSIEALRGQLGEAADALDFKARSALLIAAQLGYVAFEQFVMLSAEVSESERDDVQARVKALLDDWMGGVAAN
ncbi:MAG: helix-turn-helix domain-containing protein [Myxococcota bacterium]|nr:helix-turn-helix domain-containing protein [Myxococcota bacterium]